MSHEDGTIAGNPEIDDAQPFDEDADTPVSIVELEPGIAITELQRLDQVVPHRWALTTTIALIVIALSVAGYMDPDVAGGIICTVITGLLVSLGMRPSNHSR